MLTIGGGDDNSRSESDSGDSLLLEIEPEPEIELELELEFESSSLSTISFVGTGFLLMSFGAGIIMGSETDDAGEGFCLAFPFVPDFLVLTDVRAIANLTRASRLSSRVADSFSIRFRFSFDNFRFFAFTGTSMATGVCG